MTWFEEWFFFFEWSYGRTCARQIDVNEVWDMHTPGLNEIKDGKLALKVAALQSWPRFASFKEDEELRKNDKWKYYNGTQPIMWDMTNISAFKFEHPRTQRTTYSGIMTK